MLDAATVAFPLPIRDFVSAVVQHTSARASKPETPGGQWGGEKGIGMTESAGSVSQNDILSMTQRLAEAAVEDLRRMRAERDRLYRALDRLLEACDKLDPDTSWVGNDPAYREAQTARDLAYLNYGSPIFPEEVGR